MLVIALSPPVDEISDQVFAAHMAQHLLIGDIAALLMVIGLTGPVLQPVLHLHWVDRLRPLANPVPALSLWALNFYVWHLPFMYEAAYRNELVHAVQHLTFLVFLGTLLGNVFAWSGTVFYTFYRAGEAKHGLGALDDQSIAGAVMMIEQSLLTIFLFGWLFMRAAAEGEQKQELLEFAAAHGVELDERRAARAVSAGRADELRRRLAATPPDRSAAAAPPREAASTAGSARPGS